MKKTYLSPSTKVKTLRMEPYMLVYSENSGKWIEKLDAEDEGTDDAARANNINVWDM